MALGQPSAESPRVVVVACLAGAGAWAGVFVQQAGDGPTYAAELFGAGSDKVKFGYPTCEVSPGGANCMIDTSTDDAGVFNSPNETNAPWVKLTYVESDGFNHDGDDGTTPMEMFADGRTVDTTATTSSTKGTVTFTLTEGATFADAVASDDLVATSAGTALVPSVASGGGVGDDSVTFALDGRMTAGDAFTFILPRLMDLSALADPRKTVKVSTVGRATAGVGFPHGGSFHHCVTAPDDAKDRCNDATGADVKYAQNVAMSADAVMLSKPTSQTGDMSVRIDIEGRMALVAQTGPLSGLAGPLAPYNPRTFYVGAEAAAQLASMTLTVMDTVDGKPILQADGGKIDYALAGVLNVSVTSSAMFSEGDRVFVNWNDKAGWWEGRSIDDDEALNVEAGSSMASNTGLSIDPDDRATRLIGIYYIPGGKMEIAHGTKLTVSASINYTPNTAKDEDARSATTELRFQGVAGALQAYAIPFEGNGKGDKANVRIRCEDGDLFSQGAHCRVFLECWDDMGMRSFGELASPVMESSVMTLNAMMIEDTIGAAEPGSRHSCDVLATGSPSVQTLVRDGSSGTLVNNSFVTNN